MECASELGARGWVALHCASLKKTACLLDAVSIFALKRCIILLTFFAGPRRSVSGSGAMCWAKVLCVREWPPAAAPSLEPRATHSARAQLGHHGRGPPGQSPVVFHAQSRTIYSTCTPSAQSCVGVRCPSGPRGLGSEPYNACSRGPPAQSRVPPIKPGAFLSPRRKPKPYWLGKKT